MGGNGLKRVEMGGKGSKGRNRNGSRMDGNGPDDPSDTEEK